MRLPEKNRHIFVRIAELTFSFKYGNMIKERLDWFIYSAIVQDIADKIIEKINDKKSRKLGET